VRHHRPDAYSAEQVLLNKRQIYGGAPKLHWYPSELCACDCNQNRRFTFSRRPKPGLQVNSSHSELVTRWTRHSEVVIGWSRHTVNSSQARKNATVNSSQERSNASIRLNIHSCIVSIGASTFYTLGVRSSLSNTLFPFLPSFFLSSISTSLPSVPFPFPPFP